MILEAHKGSVETADLINQLIKYRKQEGMSQNNYNFMMQLLEVWIENPEMKMLEEFVSFVLSSDQNDELCYENYYQEHLAKKVKNVMTEKQNLRLHYESMTIDKAIASSNSIV